MAEAALDKNTARNTGPKRDPRTGRVSGGNPGNSGGKKGRSGRRPGPFKAMLAKLRDSAELAQSLEVAVSDPECRAFPAALKVLTDYDDSKPAEKRQIVGPVEVHVLIKREGRRVTAG